MKLRSKFEDLLEKCRDLERHERDLIITAFLSQELSKLVLVGGAASSWYSRGSYRTLDVDVVVLGSVEDLKDGLRELGFDRNRVWHYAPADFALDTVSRTGKPKRTRVYEVGGYEIEIASPEEVIVNDLSGYKFWDRADDFDRAKLVYETEFEDLDVDYLEERAEEEKVKDALAELKRNS
ncbi:hypothetical protein AKJ57_01300 [candidate division MSBL1 archaeon SCGC-AAA259A05]|uniref:Uncharacterized protein n=1 Tax=candidate division MSBL1 archaeon SCGC-AAA259A05 TaxID=1698259 RepID=A0A133UB52_9EURY|nr:hypothetical protein AKJ57_01300 [candidate division MSBL1 archaeon SCGC-AAA259A05]